MLQAGVSTADLVSSATQLQLGSLAAARTLATTSAMMAHLFLGGSSLPSLCHAVLTLPCFYRCHVLATPLLLLGPRSQPKLARLPPLPPPAPLDAWAARAQQQGATPPPLPPTTGSSTWLGLQWLQAEPRNVPLQQRASAARLLLPQTRLPCQPPLPARVAAWQPWPPPPA